MFDQFVKRKIKKYQKGKPMKGLTADQLPDMFGDPSETPQRYLMRLYNSPRVKKIIQQERGESGRLDDQLYQDNIEMLRTWEENRKQFPDIYNDSYKETINNLIGYYKENNRDPIDVVLGTKVEMKDNTNNPNILGWTSRNKKENIIHAFPYKHVNNSLATLPGTVVHELSHRIYPYTADKNFAQGNDSYLEKTTLGVSESTGDETIDYLSSGTEKLARINELRYILDKKGLYNAIKNNFTEKDYDRIKALNDPYIERLLDELRIGSVHKGNDKAKLFSKEEEKQNIIKLMNELAQNKENKQTMFAKKGGMINYKKQQKEGAFGAL